MTMRTIILGKWGPECFENGRYVLREQIATGSYKDETGRLVIKRAGGFWNCRKYEFPAEDPYARSPAEPPLVWRLGFMSVLKERIESEGFSGVIIREEILDETVFRLGAQEWRFYEPHQKLHFKISDPSVTLRASLLAHSLFQRCLPPSG